MIGETLDGKYEIVRKVGSGGMGSVYEARHRGTGRRVAVKVITGEFAKNETLLKRFHIEAMASGAIETQHIVQVLDTGTDPASGLPFMVMEYLNGQDLAAVIQRLEVLPPELALRLTAQACLGLQKAHDAKVVHRDIKPGNLFLSNRDDAELILKLLDFGIAKIKLDRIQQLETSGLTRTGHVLGSPLYMSPEQARGNKSIDHRTDIWSLGIVLYQLLAGRRPHEDIEALGELIIAICSEPPRPIQDVAPWVPPEVAAIVHGALLFDPAERYQSASQMLEAIKPLLPGGWALTEAMLVPLPEEARQVVAPRLKMAMQSGAHAIYRPSDGYHLSDSGVSGAGLDPTVAEGPYAASRAPAPSASGDAAYRSSYTSAPPLATGSWPGRTSMTSSPHLAEGAVPAPRASSAGTTDAAGTAEHAPSPPERAGSRVVVRAVVALVASAVVGYAVLRLVLPAPAPQGNPTAAPPAGPAAAAGAIPGAGSAAPPEVAAPAPVAAVSRLVKLVLVDKDLSVEVDGQGVVVPKDNVIDIAGPIGSVHKVRLRRGDLETTGEVTVTKDGASPPFLKLAEKAAPKAQPSAGSAKAR